MPQLARQSVPLTFLYPPRCTLQNRSFTQAAPCLAQARSAMPKMREPPQKSMRVLQKEAAQGDLLPCDLGLLPGTGNLRAVTALNSTDGHGYQERWSCLPARTSPPSFSCRRRGLNWNGTDSRCGLQTSEGRFVTALSALYSHQRAIIIS